MNTVQILIPGRPPRDIEFQENETLSQLVSRIAIDDWQDGVENSVQWVRHWHFDGMPVLNPRSFELESGQCLAGIPEGISRYASGSYAKKMRIVQASWDTEWTQAKLARLKDQFEELTVLPDVPGLMSPRRLEMFTFEGVRLRTAYAINLLEYHLTESYKHDWTERRVA